MNTLRTCNFQVVAFRHSRALTWPLQADAGPRRLKSAAIRHPTSRRYLACAYLLAVQPDAGEPLEERRPSTLPGEDVIVIVLVLVMVAAIHGLAVQMALLHSGAAAGPPVTAPKASL